MTTDSHRMQTALPVSLTLQAPAKLNLSLAILGRRDDGYHEIESLMVAVSLFDTLTVRSVETPGTRLRVHEHRHGGGSTGEVPADDRNLAIRGLQALAAAAGVEPALEIDLVKRIPAGAGLGGGSSDAAAAIRAAARLWGLAWPIERLAEVGATVGSDVPWFLPGRPAVASGRGEHVERVAGFPQLAAVVVWPGVTLSTAAVYRAWGASVPHDRPGTGDAHRLAAALAAGRWQDVWPLVRNDLEAPARHVCPEVDTVLAALARAGARCPRLTGSGSACFALTRTFQEARTIAARLAAQRTADGGTRWPAVHAVHLLGEGLVGEGLLDDELLGDSGE